MSLKKIVSLSSAVALTVAVLDVPLAEARGGGGGGGGRSHSFAAPSSAVTRSVSRAPGMHYASPRLARNVAKVHQTQTFKTQASKTQTLKTQAFKTQRIRDTRVASLQGGAKLDKGALNKMPIHSVAAGSAFYKGRLNVPQNLKPKLTVTKVPGQQFQKKMTPFVQKYWKKTFFWVAVAGIGYLTVPELYYDRFFDCIEADDYDGCVSLLSRAAF